MKKKITEDKLLVKAKLGKSLIKYILQWVACQG